MPKVELMNVLDIEKNEMEIAGWMASVSYDSKSAYEKIAKHCIGAGHLTPTRAMRFLVAISDVSRACYDKDTEILTKDGWKLFKDVVEGEEVATLNPDTNKVEFQKVVNTISYLYNGNMHEYLNQSVNLLVTPNHKMYFKRYDTRTESKFCLTPSEDINVKRFYFNKDFNINMYVGNKIHIKGYSYTRKANNGEEYVKETGDLILDRGNFLKFFAWYLGDGSVYYNEKENSHTITIAQHDIEENSEKRAIMCEVITSLGFTPTKDSQSIKFKNNSLGKFLKEIGKSSNKRIPFNLFLLFNKEYATTFIDSYLMCDGHTTKEGHKYLYTTSKELADQLQIVCNIAGITSNIWIDDRTGTHEVCGNIVNRNFPLYTISLSNGVQNTYPVIKRDSHFSEVPYNDYVYCVEVPNHIIFVRRGGKSVWCGNCSHEFVRHEIGVGKVQRSQRYVKEDGFGYVTPKAFVTEEYEKSFYIPSLDLFLTYSDLMNIDAEFYQASLDEGIKPEDARYVLPNATHTKIHCCFNWEALLQFTYRRCCTRAQWEIRQVAHLLKAEVTKFNPFLGEKLGAPCHQLGYCPEAPSCGIADTKDTVLEYYRIYKDMQNS